MGIRNWFKTRQKQQEMPVYTTEQLKDKQTIEQLLQQKKVEQVEIALEEKPVDLKNPVDRKNYVSGNCDQIMEVTKQMEEFQKEYEAVTAYLSDIQVIEGIPENSRNEVNEVARNILTLTRERNKYLNGKMRITKSQYDLIESYEDEIPKEVQKINQKEAYLTALKGDLATLEGEKHNLAYEYNGISEKRKFLKLLSIVVGAMTLFVFGVLYYVNKVYYYREKAPFILTVILVLVCAAFLAYEARKNQAQTSLNQRKLSRAISLQNTVKIKIVNTRLSLDYSYAKFNIKSSMQLTFFWEEYVKQKEINTKYKDNTELLNYYSERMVKLLRSYYVHDPEVWIRQSIALLEPKEMVEIRHRLNVRRQKLRERMDYNMETKATALNNIKQVLKKNPTAKEEIVDTLRKYNINL